MSQHDHITFAIILATFAVMAVVGRWMPDVAAIGAAGLVAWLISMEEQQ